jgi:hypothetical protein
MFLLLQHGEHVGTVCGENESRSIRQSLFHAVPATTTRPPRARELKKQAPLNLPNDDRSRPNDVERVRTRTKRARKPPAFREKINSRVYKPRVEASFRPGVDRTHIHHRSYSARQQSFVSARVFEGADAQKLVDHLDDGLAPSRSVPYRRSSIS